VTLGAKTDRSITWGVAIFGASRRAWMALPEATRAALKSGLATLQEEIWRGAEQETFDGLACNAGRPDCVVGSRGRMTIVEDRPQDQACRREVLGGHRGAGLGAALRR
jgi:hypothetical protein